MYSFYTQQTMTAAARLRRFTRSLVENLARPLMLQKGLWIGCFMNRFLDLCPTLGTSQNLEQNVNVTQECGASFKDLSPSLGYPQRTMRNLPNLLNADSSIIDIHSKTHTTSGRYWHIAIPT